MHGDIALIESVLSPRCFFRLVEIGVPFPHDRMGGYVGYKTDHDPRQRATSAGPWTSREMVRSLLREIHRRGLKIFDGHEVIALIADENRVYGAAALDKNRLAEPSFGLTLFLAENVVFGVGGPGGLYQKSVYPDDHAGAIGLALEIGAKTVVKGLRAVTDFDYEIQMSQMNRHLSGDVVSLFVATKPEYGYLSSSLVKEVARLGGSVDDLVPPIVAEALKERLG